MSKLIFIRAIRLLDGKIQSPERLSTGKISFGAFWHAYGRSRPYFCGGKNINDLPLDNFVGACRVLDASECNEAVSKEYLEKFNIASGEKFC